jgi:hypothetical protein
MQLGEILIQAIITLTRNFKPHSNFRLPTHFPRDPRIGEQVNNTELKKADTNLHARIDVYYRRQGEL